MGTCRVSTHTATNHPMRRNAGHEAHTAQCRLPGAVTRKARSATRTVENCKAQEGGRQWRSCLLRQAGRELLPAGSRHQPQPPTARPAPSAAAHCCATSRSQRAAARQPWPPLRAGRCRRAAPCTLKIYAAFWGTEPLGVCPCTVRDGGGLKFQTAQLQCRRARALQRVSACSCCSATI